MPHNRQNKIAVINDFTGFGRCSLAASIPILSAMKIQCCPLPTAIFSNHTGFDSFYYTDYTPHMEAHIREWKKLDLRFRGILTGFLGSPEQIDMVQRFFESFRTSETITVMDPVMGDYGRLYPTYSPQLAAQMRRLVPYADILTPNLTEACLLTGTPYRADMDERCLNALCRTLSEMGPEKIVISGIECGETMKNVVYQRGKPPEIVTTQKVGPCRSGTGDVFSSILAADAVHGVEFVEAVRHASAFIARVLRRTVELGLPETDGIAFEEFLQTL